MLSKLIEKISQIGKINLPLEYKNEENTKNSILSPAQEHSIRAQFLIK